MPEQSKAEIMARMRKKRKDEGLKEASYWVQKRHAERVAKELDKLIDKISLEGDS